MNTKLHSSKNIMPLAGSVCGLIAGLALAFSSVPGAFAKEPARRGAEAPAEAKTETKTAPRTPDEAVRVGLEYLLKQQQSGVVGFVVVVLSSLVG